MKAKKVEVEKASPTTNRVDIQSKGKGKNLTKPNKEKLMPSSGRDHEDK